LNLDDSTGKHPSSYPVKSFYQASRDNWICFTWNMYDLEYGVSGLERGWTNKKWEVFDHITSPEKANEYVSRGTWMT
jgi:hypothetical protein